MNNQQTYEIVVKLLKKFPEMYKTCFVDKGSYIYRDKGNLEQCLNYIQKIVDTFTNTTNIDFNRTLYKLLGSVGSYPYYHYCADEYMDYLSHGMVTKEIIEFQSIAYFIEEKYINNADIYVTVFAADNRSCPLNLSVYIDVLGKTDVVSLSSFFLIHKNKNIKFTLSDFESKKDFYLTSTKVFTYYTFGGTASNFSRVENTDMWDDRNWNFNS